MKSFDVELAKQPSKKKQKTIFRAFLDDFERQQFDLSERTKDDLEGRKWIVGTLYTFDMLLCYCIIGKHIGQISFLIASFPIQLWEWGVKMLHLLMYQYISV